MLEIFRFFTHSKDSNSIIFIKLSIQRFQIVKLFIITCHTSFYTQICITIIFNKVEINYRKLLIYNSSLFNKQYLSIN